MNLSEDARTVLLNVGSGRVLAVARDGSHAKLVPVPKRNMGNVEYDVAMVAAEEAIASGRLRELTEHGEPPLAERNPLQGYKLGWRELELSGEGYRLFCCVQ